MSSNVIFRPYTPEDRPACEAVFDANCPDFFLPNERPDYLHYLDEQSEGYEVCMHGDQVRGAFGIWFENETCAHLSWIMIDPNAKGHGVGTQMIERTLSRCRAGSATLLKIAASHRSAPFFARFGAKETRYTEDGWGPGMHRIDMELPL